MAGALVPLHFGREAKIPYPLTLEIYIQLTSKLVQKFIQIKSFKKCPNGPVHSPNFADVSTCFMVTANFLKNQNF